MALSQDEIDNLLNKVASENEQVTTKNKNNVFQSNAIFTYCNRCHVSSARAKDTNCPYCWQIDQREVRLRQTKKVFSSQEYILYTQQKLKKENP